jgi:hypothetical protein
VVVLEVDPNRPWYDKLVDYLVGDTPEQLSVRVCEKCGRENGFISNDGPTNLRNWILKSDLIA